MNNAAFLSAVKEEIARLQQIQDLLEHGSANGSSDSATKPPSGKRGGMSEDGKARVAEAQRKRWAAKKAAAEAASGPARKQAAAPAKKSAKFVGAVPPAKKQKAPASKPTAVKTAVAAKKALVKKPAVATKPTAAKKAIAAKKHSAGQAAPKKQVPRVRQQPDSNAGAEAADTNTPILDTAPAVTEDASSNE